MAGQHQRVRRYIALEARQRSQIDAKRIALRIHRLHADIGTDLGQRLIGTQEQLLGAAVEHHLLGCVAAASQDLEAARANGQEFAGDEAAECARQAGDHAQVAMAVGKQALGMVSVEPVRAVEAAIGLRV